MPKDADQRTKEGMSNGEQAAGSDATERMVLALKASNEGIWDWHPAESGIYYSRRALEFLECAMFGAPNLFLPPYSLVHDDDRTEFKARLECVLESGGPELFAIDCRVHTASGGWRWLRIRGAVLRDGGGHVQRMTGSMIDISRRKAVEAELAEERHLMRQLIDSVPLQIYFKDRDSRFVMVNHRMAEWFGASHPSEMVGKHDSDSFTPEHWQPALEAEQQIMASGVPIVDVLEKETWTTKGNETWVLTSKFPWRDSHGHVKGTFGVSGDVTEVVMAKKRAEDLAAQLEVRNRAYEEELQLAREIQQALARGNFPVVLDNRQPHAETIRFGARYVPITGLAGDFFEVLPISKHAAGILICDVMGHGVRSALIVAMLRGLLEKQIRQAGDPAAFLRGLNDGLGSILVRADVTMFATAFYAVADLERGTLRYACAGHPGAITAGPGGVRQLAVAREEKGPALGLIRNVRYPVGEIALAEVDRMLMFTDGILEAENDRGEAFLEKRLLEAISRIKSDSLEGMLDDVLARVLEFSEHNHFDDDVCMLGMEIERAPALVTPR